MKVTMVLTQDTPEVLWNSFRLANMMIKGGEAVDIFLNGPSVGYEELDSDQSQLVKLAEKFTLSGGNLFA